MRIFSALLALGLFSTACTTSTAPTASTASPTASVSTKASAQEASAMQLINSQRQATRMSPLTLDPRLIRAAQLHAQDMANTGYFSHTGRNGSTVKTRVSGQGFKGCYWAENIGQGQADANAIVSAWMGSSKHRKNILSRKAKAVGVGLADRTWVAVFAAPC